METIIVLIVVGVAAGLLARHYYKKYKKGNQGSCGCASCPADAACCDLPEKRDQQLSSIRQPRDNQP